tara:strand:+ start:638 stop:949 length:312 start_codon:yes stop_codon:yes gene_type:complete
MTELKDLEMCKKIAEIEGIDYFESDGIISSQNELGQCREYNPLTDDALCFQLMVKYEVSVDSHYGVVRINPNNANRPQLSQISYMDITINKAICLAIIEAHNE